MRTFALQISAGAFFAFSSSGAVAESASVVLANGLVWKAAPGAFQRGAEVATLFGDPTKAGPFVIRLRAPGGYQIAAHSHEDMELLTVISGAFRFGQGKQIDPGVEKFVHAGDFVAIPPGVEHWLVANEDAVVQVNGVGPMKINYLDPRDDTAAAPTR